MNDNAITIFVVDDNIPQSQDFVEKEIYNKAISTSDLVYLIENEDWLGEQNLQELLRYIISHELTKAGKIIIKGFTHPEICLTHIENFDKPDVVIYDWEYGSEHANNSSQWLMEIIELTNAFIFVYSGVRQYIPTHLNKKEFNLYSDRFQLFGKGNNKDSIFSSEEFILQYVVNQIQSNNQIRIQGISVNFSSSGYLKEVSDILHLENIFDRASILESLKNGINEESVKKLLLGTDKKILFDNKRNFLLTNDSELLIEKFMPSESFTYEEIVAKYGLSILEETLKRGILKV